MFQFLQSQVIWVTVICADTCGNWNLEALVSKQRVKLIPARGDFNLAFVVWSSCKGRDASILRKLTVFYQVWFCVLVTHTQKNHEVSVLRIENICHSFSVWFSSVIMRSSSSCHLLSTYDVINKADKVSKDFLDLWRVWGELTLTTDTGIRVQL